MLENRTIRSIDQRSAHQNAIIAFKKWEQETREFLTNPERNYETDTREIKIAIGHPTPPDQLRSILKSSSRSQKSPRAKAHQSGVSRSRQK